LNRPIFLVVIGYIIGILWGLYLKISIVPFYILIIAIYIIINLPYSKRKFKIFSIKRYFRYIKLILKINIILIIMISSFISNLIIKFQENKYQTLFKDKQELEVIAIVVSNKKEKDYYNRYKIKTISNEYLYINVDKKQKLEYGDKVLLKGEFQEPQTARNYKGFNYKEYLKTLKIYGTVNVSTIKLLDKNCANKLMQISNSLFLKIKENIEKTYSQNISSIVLGVMLGYTEDIDENIKEDFSTSNISHVLAVSGMHISYIIFLITKSTQKILGKKKSKIIASFVLLAYMFITGFSVSVVRASIMGILTCMSFIVYRKSDTLNNIAISALITLINNPYSINGVSFALTYGGTLGIIYFQPIVNKIIKNVKIRNRKWKYVFLKIQRKYEKILDIIAVSISAQIIIAPIMVMNFNTIGIGFLLTNLLLSCVIGIIVMGGFVQILVSFASITAGVAFAKLIEIPTYGLLLISKIDLGNFEAVTPDFYQIILYYLAICILRYLYIVFHLKYCNSTQERVKNTIYLIKYKLRPYFSKIIITLIFIVVLFMIVSFVPHNLNIYFIDVGQGESTLIVTPKHKTILIDGGGNSNYDVGKNILIPYLLDRKITTLDYVIISHFDEDHVGGILPVLEELKVKQVIINKQVEDSENYQKFLTIVKEKKIKIIQVEKGNVIFIEKDLYFDIIWPSKNQILENALNNNSIVCKLNYKDFSMLFTGDIENIAEQKILENVNNNLLNADVLKVAHHGSKTSSINEFIEKVKPKIALIGVGKNNKFGHPNNEVVKRMDELRYSSI